MNFISTTCSHYSVLEKEIYSTFQCVTSMLSFVLEILQKESDRINTAASTLATCSDKDVMRALRPKQMIQAVKAVCALLGNMETIEVIIQA